MDGQIAFAGIALMKNLAADKSKPVFLAVGFKKQHLPCIAPKKYWDLYELTKLSKATHTCTVINDSGYAMHDIPEFRTYSDIADEGPIPEATERRFIQDDCACVRFVDAQIGRVIAELDAQDLAQNTTVVPWGDPGFHLGDHGMFGKHSTLEAAARVPLLIIPPVGSAMKQSAAPVEFTNIFTTLCRLSGITVPSHGADHHG